MQFSAIHTLTLLDYPDKISAIVFTPGCNMRCNFCHNSEFVLPEKIKNIQHDFIPEEKILNFLKTRIGKLDGLVISGGEPTIHPDLLKFIRKVKELKFLVKLDTNGTNPNVVAEALKDNLVDYIAMDIKASKEKYDVITGIKNNFANIEASKNLILNSNIDYEFRTTVIKGFHDESEIEKITKFCEGAKKYSLQNYRNGQVLNPAWKSFTGFNEEDLEKFKKIAQKYIKNVIILK